ncbi:Ankrd49 [Carabus blaptoides fortunei]
MPHTDLSRFEVSGWDDDLNDIQEEKDPHETPDKEILWAAEKEKIELAKKLLESNPSLVHSRDEDGYTPLHRACYNNNTEFVDLLLSYDADIAAKTEFQWQPLHSACQWNNYRCVVKLLQHGADVNAKSNGGQTPLHIAASHGASYETVQLLLSHPYIQPQILNSNNETAYDIAKRSSKYYRIFDMSLSMVNGIE